MADFDQFVEDFQKRLKLNEVYSTSLVQAHTSL